MKKARAKWLNILVPVVAIGLMALILFAPDRGGRAAIGGNTLKTGIEWVSSNRNAIQLPYDLTLRINDSLTFARLTQDQSSDDRKQLQGQGIFDNTLMLPLLAIILAIGSVNIISSMIETSSVRTFLSRRIRKKSISSGCLWTIDIKGLIHISSRHQVRIT